MLFAKGRALKWLLLLLGSLPVFAMAGGTDYVSRGKAGMVGVKGVKCVDCSASGTSNAKGVGRHVRYGLGFGGDLRLWDEGTVYGPEYGPWVSLEVSLTPGHASAEGVSHGGWNSSAVGMLSTRRSASGLDGVAVLWRRGGGSDYFHAREGGLCVGVRGCTYDVEGLSGAKLWRPGTLDGYPAAVRSLVADARALVVEQADGSYEVYGGEAGALVEHGDGYEAWQSALVDRQGLVLRYEYERYCVSGCGGSAARFAVRLSGLLDATGLRTRFYYADNDPRWSAEVRAYHAELMQVSEGLRRAWTSVEDPYGRVARYEYQDLVTGLRLGDGEPKGDKDLLRAVRDGSGNWRLRALVDVLGVESQVRYRCGSPVAVRPGEVGPDTGSLPADAWSLTARVAELVRVGCLQDGRMTARAFEPWQTQTPLGTYTYTRIEVTDGAGGSRRIRRGYIVEDPAGGVERVEALFGEVDERIAAGLRALGGGQLAGSLLGARPAHVPEAVWARVAGLRVSTGYRTRLHWTHKATDALLEEGRATGAQLRDPAAVLPVSAARIQQYLHDRPREDGMTVTSPVLMAERQPGEGWVFYGYADTYSALSAEARAGQVPAEADFLDRRLLVRAGQVEELVPLTLPIIVARRTDGGQVQAQLARYNARGQAVLAVDALGRAQEIEYEANGLDARARYAARWQVDAASPQGRITRLEELARYGYNARGQLNEIQGSAGRTLRLGYGEVVPYALESVTDLPSGRVTRYGRRVLNPLAAVGERVIQHWVQDPDGHEASTDYQRGWRIASRAGGIEERWVGHDAFGRPQSYLHNDQVRTVYAYDGLRLASVRDVAGQTLLEFGTDYLNRVTDTRLTDAFGRLVQAQAQAYDASGGVAYQWDSLGGVKHWRYDIAGRPIAYGLGLAEQGQMEYGPESGQLQRSVDARGIARRVEYTAAGEPWRVWIQEPGMGERLLLELGYDAVYGRLMRQRDALGERAYRYDARQPYRLVEMDEPLPGDGGASLTHYLDYEGGRQVGWRVQAAGALQADSYRRYHYDSRLRVLRIASEAMDVIPGYAPDAAPTYGRVEGLGYDLRPEPGAEVQLTLGYTSDQLVTRREYRSALDSLYHQVHLDERLRIWRSEGLIEGGMQDYQYDARGQLVGEKRSQFDAAGRQQVSSWQGYGYDGDGNRTQVLDLDLDTGAPLRVRAQAQYGLADMLQDYNGRLAQYDAAGNLTYDPSNGNQYTYNGENRLSRIDYGKGNYTLLTYDAGGWLRRVREYDQDALTQDLSYVYRDGELIQVRNTRDLSLVRTINGDAYIDYTRNADGKPVLRKYLMLRNHQGSVIGRMDERGQLIERVDYDAWGQVQKRQLRDAAGNLSNTANLRSDMPQGYAGYLQLHRSGLYLLHHRAYNPKLGRFTQPDPIGTAGGNNLYRYAHNAPNLLSDPSGLMTFDELIVVWSTTQRRYSTDVYSQPNLPANPRDCAALRELLSRERVLLAAAFVAMNARYRQLGGSAIGGRNITVEEASAMWDRMQRQSDNADSEFGHTIADTYRMLRRVNALNSYLGANCGGGGGGGSNDGSSGPAPASSRAPTLQFYPGPGDMTVVYAGGADPATGWAALATVAALATIGVAATPGVREETAGGLVVAGAAAAFAGLAAFGSRIEEEARRALSW